LLSRKNLVNRGNCQCVWNTSEYCYQEKRKSRHH
jgi:hypothetical protein